MMFLQTASASGVRRRIADPRDPACASGKVTDAVEVVAITLHGGWVYFGDQAGNVRRVPKIGGAATLLTQVPGRTILQIAVDETYVYFETIGSLPSDGAVYRVHQEGGPHAALISGIRAVWEMVVDDDFLYAVSRGTPTGFNTWESDGSILRVRKDGSEVQTLLSRLTLPGGLALEDGWLYFTEHGAADGSSGGALRRVPVNGGAVELVAEIARPLDFVRDRDAYYICVRGAIFDEIVRVPRVGGSREWIASQIERPFLQDLHLIGESVYYVNGPGARNWIEAVPVSGGPARAITGAIQFPFFGNDSCTLVYSSRSTVERALP